MPGWPGPHFKFGTTPDGNVRSAEEFGFRCRDDEVPVEVLSLRHFVGELPGPRVGT
ncbi:hypothetical protein SAMN05519103_09411 [Rhizobiales bacterium GAS113]|nr:hypothetical protein SAMN05519103_09411 [Rhizobiales bacterium GAS113]